MERRFDPGKREGLLSSRRWERWQPLSFLSRLHVHAGQVVLDVGCGPGFWTLALAELVGPGGTVLALDVSREMLDALTARQPAGQVRALRGELPAIGLADGSVDRIWAAFVFHEVEPPERLATEMRRVTRRGGRVALLEWRPDAEGTAGPPASHRLSPALVGGQLRAAGFQNTVQSWQDEEAYLVEAY